MRAPRIRGPNKPNNMPTSILRRLAPTFCWVTAHDLFIMAEYINEDLEFESFQVTLCGLCREGMFISKPYSSGVNPNNRGPKPRLYLRVK
jgi:hypothetical protein